MTLRTAPADVASMNAAQEESQMRHSFRIALALATVAALALPSVALAADGPPEVSLGRFEGAYLALRPLITVLFVVMGLYTAMRRLWGTLTRLGTTPEHDSLGAFGSDLYRTQEERPGFGIGKILSPILYIGVIVGVAVFVLWFGVDMLNAAMRFFWEAAYGGASIAVDPTPSVSSPDPTVTP